MPQLRDSSSSSMIPRDYTHRSHNSISHQADNKKLDIPINYEREKLSETVNLTRRNRESGASTSRPITNVVQEQITIPTDYRCYTEFTNQKDDSFQYNEPTGRFHQPREDYRFERESIKHHRNMMNYPQKINDVQDEPTPAQISEVSSTISVPSPLQRYKFFSKGAELQQRLQQLNRSAQTDYDWKNTSTPLNFDANYSRQTSASRYTVSSRKGIDQKIKEFRKDSVEPFRAQTNGRNMMSKNNSRSYSQLDLNPKYSESNGSRTPAILIKEKGNDSRRNSKSRKSLKSSKSLKDLDSINNSPLERAGKDLSKSRPMSRHSKNEHYHQIQKGKAEHIQYNLPGYNNRQTTQHRNSHLGGYDPIRAKNSFEKLALKSDGDRSNKEYKDYIEQKVQQNVKKYKDQYNEARDRSRFSFGPIRESPTLQDQDSSFWTTRRPLSSAKDSQGAQGSQNKTYLYGEYRDSTQKYPTQWRNEFKIKIRPCPEGAAELEGNRGYRNYSQRDSRDSRFSAQMISQPLSTPNRYPRPGKETAYKNYSGFRPSTQISQNREELQSLISELRGQLTYYEQQAKTLDQDSRYSRGYR